MNSEFWINKWENGETRFHQSDYHALLVNFVDKFTIGTILVPLCGKSLDMLYLLSKGHHVVGVELSPIACRNFFEDAKINYTITTDEEFTVYHAENISLWCGDYFKLPQKVWDSVSGIYDRAALIALPDDIRKKYAFDIFNRSAKSLEIILISLEYLKDVIQGPPFSIHENELQGLYSSFQIQKLGIKKQERVLNNLNTIEMTETVYWMQKI